MLEAEAAMGASTIGVIANPMSGRDIRRLVAQASVFPNAEKANMVLRLISAAGRLAVDRVLVSADDAGIAAAVRRAHLKQRDAGAHPEVTFLRPEAPEGTAADTRDLVRRMRAQGADAIALLGGDGTIRAAVPELGDTPVLPLSTGTNNAFPQVWEATVAGVAISLLATGRIGADEAAGRPKVLWVECGRAREPALVDVCVSTETDVGARALWRVGALRELYCTFARPQAIGLSAVAGQLDPTAPEDEHGVAVHLSGTAPAPRSVLAPIAPGLLDTVGVLGTSRMTDGVSALSTVPAGTVALDGERELEFGGGDPVRITLRRTGPRVVDIGTVLRLAADRGLLRTEDGTTGGAGRTAAARGAAAQRETQPGTTAC
ncbi:ATP-NAD kinase family protein [Salinifilum ghardaiensis]